MKCPFCGFENLQGIDECEHCGEDLTAFDGAKPKDKLEKSLLKDPIEALHFERGESVAPETSVREVAEILARTNRCVLVVEAEALVGIVTERDLLFKVMGSKQDLDRTTAKEIMTPQPESLAPSDKLAFALNKMAIGGYRHIPLVRDGRPIGAISVRDILGYLADMFPNAVASASDPVVPEMSALRPQSPANR